MAKFVFVDTATGNPVFTSEPADPGYLTDGAEYGTNTCRRLGDGTDDNEVLSTWYWSLTDQTFKLRIRRPSPTHYWNPQSEQWEIDITAARELRLALLKRERNSATAFFTWDGSTFDLDAKSEARISAMKADALDGLFEPTLWRLADNSWRLLSASDAIEVYKAGRAHLRACFQRFATLEAQVLDPNASLEDIEAVVW